MILAAVLACCAGAVGSVGAAPKSDGDQLGESITRQYAHQIVKLWKGISEEDKERLHELRRLTKIDMREWPFDNEDIQWIREKQRLVETIKKLAQKPDLEFGFEHYDRIDEWDEDAAFAQLQAVTNSHHFLFLSAMEAERRGEVEAAIDHYAHSLMLSEHLVSGRTVTSALVAMQIFNDAWLRIRSLELQGRLGESAKELLLKSCSRFARDDPFRSQEVILSESQAADWLGKELLAVAPRDRWDRLPEITGYEQARIVGSLEWRDKDGVRRMKECLLSDQHVRMETKRLKEYYLEVHRNWDIDDPAIFIKNLRKRSDAGEYGLFGQMNFLPVFGAYIKESRERLADFAELLALCGG